MPKLADFLNKEYEVQESVQPPPVQQPAQPSKLSLYLDKAFGADTTVVAPTLQTAQHANDPINVLAALKKPENIASTQLPEPGLPGGTPQNIPTSRGTGAARIDESVKKVADRLGVPTPGEFGVYVDAVRSGELDKGKKFAQPGMELEEVAARGKFVIDRVRKALSFTQKGTKQSRRTIGQIAPLVGALSSMLDRLDKAEGPITQESLEQQAEQFTGAGAIAVPLATDITAESLKWYFLGKAFEGVSGGAEVLKELPQVQKAGKVIESLGGIQKVQKTMPRTYQAGKNAVGAFIKGYVVGTGKGAIEGLSGNLTDADLLIEMNRQGLAFGTISLAFSTVSSVDQVLAIRQLRTQMMLRGLQQVRDLSKGLIRDPLGKGKIKSLQTFEDAMVKHVDNVVAAYEAELSGAIRGELFKNIRGKAPLAQTEITRFLKKGYDPSAPSFAGKTPLQPGKPRLDVLRGEPTTKAGEVVKAVKRPVKAIKGAIKAAKEAAPRPSAAEIKAKGLPVTKAPPKKAPVVKELPKPPAVAPPKVLTAQEATERLAQLESKAKGTEAEKGPDDEIRVPAKPSQFLTDNERTDRILLRRLVELNDKASGTKEITGPDGKVIEPAQPSRFLTVDEKTERDVLREKLGTVPAVAPPKAAKAQEGVQEDQIAKLEGKIRIVVDDETIELTEAAREEFDLQRREVQLARFNNEEDLVLFRGISQNELDSINKTGKIEGGTFSTPFEQKFGAQFATTFEEAKRAAFHMEKEKGVEGQQKFVISVNVRGKLFAHEDPRFEKTSPRFEDIFIDKSRISGNLGASIRANADEILEIVNVKKEKVIAAVVKIGDQEFEGTTHADAVQKAVDAGVAEWTGEGVLKKVGDPSAEIASDLFKTSEGRTLDRLQVRKITGGKMFAEAIKTIPKEIEREQKEAIIEPAPSPAVEQGKAGKPVSDITPTGTLDPTDPADALEITKLHADWVAGGSKFDLRSVWEGIRTTKIDRKTATRIVESVEYTPEQVDTAYRLIQKPIESPMPDVSLFAMPGKEKQLTVIAEKMRRMKAPKVGKKKFKLTKPKPLPKAKTKKEDSIKAVFVAATSDPGRFALGGVSVEDENLVATDGHRLFIAKGKWGKNGLYLNKATLAKGILGKADKEKKFIKWQVVVPLVSKSDAIIVDDLETIWRRVRQASLITSEESKGVIILLNKDGSLGFSAAAPEVGHSEINVWPGAKILAGVNPQFLLDAIAFHATRGDTSIEFYFQEPDRPILTRSPDGKTSTVLMPVNIGGVSKELEKTISEAPISAKAEEVTTASVIKPPPTKQIKSLRKAADTLQKQIDAKRDPAVAQQNVTRRRAGQIAGLADDADRLEDQQQALRAIADASEKGELPASLAGIKNRAEIEAIMPKKQYSEPGIRKGDVDDIWNATKGVRGAPAIKEDLAGFRLSSTPSGFARPLTVDNVDDVSKLVKLAEFRPEISSFTLSSVKDEIRDARRLLKLGIKNEADFKKVQSDLQSLLSDKPKEVGATKQIREKIHALIGVKIPGFFPTPKPTIDKLIDLADIEAGMSVLEPSAGKGDIAESLKEAGHEPDVIEVVPSLQEILKLKGFNLVGSDVLEFTGKKYDRIVMNPPFEKGQDIEHVQRAYELLKPGGRLVSIMSEGTFFNTQKKFEAFREWLSDKGHSEKLEQGSFKGKEAFRQTGTATRVVVIDKPAKKFTPDPTTETGAEGKPAFAGVAGRPGGKRAKPWLDLKRTKSPNEDIEAFFGRTQKMPGGFSLKKIMERVRFTLRGAFLTQTPHLETVPRTAFVRDLIRTMPEQQRAAREKAVLDILAILEGDGSVKALDHAGLDLLRRKVFIQDLVFEAKIDRSVSGDFTLEQLQAEDARLLDLINQVPSVKKAYEARQALWKKVSQDLFERGVLNEESRDNVSYVRHFVLEYMENNRRPISTKKKKLKEPFRTSKIRRIGSRKDISTDYLAVEVRALADIYADNVIEDIADSIATREDKKQEFKATARAKNFELLVGGKVNVNRILELREDPEKTKEEIEELQDLDPTYFIRQKMAIAFGRLNKEDDFDDENINLFKELARIVREAPDSDEGIAARTIFKAISERKKLIKESLGDRFVTTSQVAEQVGYVEWHYKRPNLFYRAATMDQAKIAAMIEEYAVEAGDTINVPRNMIHTALVLGRREGWYIPEDLAMQLDDLPINYRGHPIIEGMSVVSKHAIQWWKRWILRINPFRYNARNQLGDTERMLASGQESALKRIPQSIKILITKKGEYYEGGKEYGVVGSSLWHEMGDVSRLREFEQFKDFTKKKTFKQYTKNILLLPLRTVSRVGTLEQDLTQLREDVLRMAVYIENLEKMRAGKKVRHWAGSIADIEAIQKESKERAAAKISRETLIDYGSFTIFEDKVLRNGLIPFYSFKKRNLTFWPRALVNATREGKGRPTAAIALSRGTFNIAKWLIRVMFVYAVGWLWNHRDDDSIDKEEAMPFWLRANPHLNIGDKTIWGDTALADFGEWIDYEGLSSINWRHQAGYMDTREAAMEAAKVIAQAPFNNLAQALNPFIKAPVTAVTGQTIYPNIFDPRFIASPASKKSLERAILSVLGSDARKFFETAKGDRRIEDTLYAYFAGWWIKPNDPETIAEQVKRTKEWTVLKRKSKTTGRKAGEAKKGREAGFAEAQIRREALEKRSKPATKNETMTLEEFLRRK